jgi:hypothetical protein
LTVTCSLLWSLTSVCVQSTELQSPPGGRSVLRRPALSYCHSS